MKKNNNAHLHGYINGILENDFDGKKSFRIDLATIEVFKDNAGETQKKYSYHNVSLLTDDKKLIKGLQTAKKDIEANLANREDADFKPKVHTATVDGTLVTRKNTAADGKVYYNNIVIADPETFQLDAKLGEKESRNRAEFKGNIASIDMHDTFAVISVATHYFIPGEGENFKGEKKPYTEATSYAETRINANRLPKTFESLKNGEIAVGDLIEVRGQMHNNRFVDGKETSQNKIVVDLNKVELVAKKGQKKAEAEEKKEAPAKKTAAKPKKATPRKKGVTM